MMKQHNTEHLDDDFLKSLVKKSVTETPPANFTEKVMAGLPAGRTVEAVEKEGFMAWQWVGLAAAAVGAIYFIITFDFSRMFNRMADVESADTAGYVNMFASVFKLFSNAFSAFQFTSVSLMIVIAGITLYLGDRFLRKWTQGRFTAIII